MAAVCSFYVKKRSFQIKKMYDKRLSERCDTKYLYGLLMLKAHYDRLNPVGWSFI